jgi:hypothetical protein
MASTEVGAGGCTAIVAPPPQLNCARAGTDVAAHPTAQQTHKRLRRPMDRHLRVPFAGSLIVADSGGAVKNESDWAAVDNLTRGGASNALEIAEAVLG